MKDLKLMSAIVVATAGLMTLVGCSVEPPRQLRMEVISTEKDPVMIDGKPQFRFMIIGKKQSIMNIDLPEYDKYDSGDIQREVKTAVAEKRPMCDFNVVGQRDPKKSAYIKTVSLIGCRAKG